MNPIETSGRQEQSTSANYGQHMLFEKQLMTYDEAAAYISALWRPTSGRTVRRYVALGLIPAERPNGYNVALKKAAIDDWLSGSSRRARRR